MQIKIIRYLQYTTLAFLFGCGSGKEMIQIILECDENANGGNAVVVTLYQLTSADKFRLLNFEALIKTPEISLGSDLVINSKFERTMVPGETLDLNELEIKNGAVFLGVIADFHSPAPEDWKYLIPLNKDIDKLIISVHENSIAVQKAD